jgi:hypothetical protein
MRSLAGLAAVTLATTALAQQEQWLRYQTVTEGRGYRWLDLTTNPPPNVSLPKLAGQIYFARWTTPLDPAGGRWLCFERTRKSTPWNRVFADTTGNGRLDDKKAIDAAQIEDYRANFDPIKFVFKGEDGPLTYHLLLHFYKYSDDQVRLLAYSGCEYEGKITVGGKKRTFTLVDGNANGTFNDLGPEPQNCDRVVVEGDKTPIRYLGKLLEIDGQLYQFEAARDGAFLKIKPAENVKLCQIRVPEAISEFTALGETGHFVRQPAKGEFTLPAGNYRIEGWEIKRKDDKGASWTLSGYGFSTGADFQAAPDKPTLLQCGEPIQLNLLCSEYEKDQLSFSLRPLGQFGESIEILRGIERPRGPKLTLASLDGKIRLTNSFEFG